MVEKILVVDGEPSIRRLIKDWFRKCGFRECIVDTTGSHEAAANLTLLNGYSIIVVDCTIPDLSGIALTSKIRENSPEAVIIGMSAHWGVDHMFCEAGADYFLRKPINFRYLKSIVYRSSKSGGPR